MKAKEDVYMDGYLKKNLELAKKAMSKDYDMVICVDGAERSGKSVIAQQIGIYLDPTLTIDRITFTADDFKNKIREAKNFQCVILDEAMQALFSRASMSKTNINVVRLLAECGQKNLIIILVLPSFFALDMYAAVHRSRCLIHVYTHGLQRGYFKFYGNKNKKILYLGGKKFYHYGAGKPNFKGRFTNTYVVDETEYRKKKADSLKHSDSDSYDLHKIFAVELRKTHETSECMKILKGYGININQRTFQRWVKEYKDAHE